MGLLRALLLGDLGNDLNIVENEERIAQNVRGIHRVLRRKSRRDRTQDEKLAALEREKEELEITLAALIRLLLAKNVVTKADLEKLTTEIAGEIAGEKQRLEEEQRLANPASSVQRKSAPFSGSALA